MNTLLQVQPARQKQCAGQAWDEIGDTRIPESNGPETVSGSGPFLPAEAGRFNRLCKQH